jgi:hypothetical protein
MVEVIITADDADTREFSQTHVTMSRAAVQNA